MEGDSRRDGFARWTKLKMTLSMPVTTAAKVIARAVTVSDFGLGHAENFFASTNVACYGSFDPAFPQQNMHAI